MFRKQDDVILSIFMLDVCFVSTFFFYILTREHGFKSFQNWVPCHLKWFLYHEKSFQIVPLSFGMIFVPRNLVSCCDVFQCSQYLLSDSWTCRATASARPQACRAETAKSKWIRRKRRTLPMNRLRSVWWNVRPIDCALLCLCQPLISNEFDQIWNVFVLTHITD